jgi:hypothetical protein
MQFTPPSSPHIWLTEDPLEASNELRDRRAIWLLQAFNQAEALMNSLMKVLLTLVTVVGLAGCASPMQWWRVGNCLVIYDTRSDDDHQILVAGQQCDIKREGLSTMSGGGR